MCIVIKNYVIIKIDYEHYFLQKILDCYCGYKNDMEGYLDNLIQCTVTLAVNIIPGNLEKLP